MDKRVELLSIACRLADYEEYSNPKNQLYVADISAHFEPYKNHPLIECLRQLKKENGIGYDAIAFMAVSIGQPPAFDPIIPFSEKPIPDSRWSAESATKCVALLQQFYDDAHCAEFFDTQKQRYEFYERQIAKIYLHNVDLAWMERWFGTCENARYNIIVAPGNGTHCYGPKYTDTRGVTDYYAITGLFTDKELDSAAFSIDTPYLIPLIVHEFSHSFVNTVVDRNLHRLGKYADQIVRRSPETDTYNHGETLLYESLVRAVVYKYLKAHHASEETFKRQQDWDTSQGFPWIQQLVDYLDQYEQHRDKYPTFESFAKKLQKFYRGRAENL